ncbi:MAG: FAD-dependent oxidoreductase, partial [Planctomycetota bacterium]
MTDEVSARLLDAFIARRTLLRGTGFAGVRLVGSGDDQRTQELLEFLYKNHVPFSLHDPATAEGAQALECLGTDKPRLPAVLHAEYAAERPEVSEVASALGILHPVGEEPYDLVVVGAGPSGLAATVYAASEGVRTLTVDRLGPGGQAASSSRIENFIGFPTGISGADLASRGYLQALKFGARFAIPASVESLAPDGDEFVRMALSTGETVRARAALITSGVYYRRLPLENGHDFTGSGVYYSATSVQAVACRESTAVVVGGGNSAGQAAMYLSQHASRVIMTIRSGNLAASMSAYLRERIDRTPNIEIRYHTEVKDLRGDHALRGVTLEQNKTGEREDLDCAGVFVFIGARPNTEWLPDAIALDERGYVLTGPQASASGWPLEREPCVLETSMARVLAGGDIRSGTTKRCGFAVGDGSLAVSCV